MYLMTPFIKSHICVHVYTITYKPIHIKSYYDFVNVYKVNCKNVAQTIDNNYRDRECVYLCMMGAHTEMAVKNFLKSFMCILLLNLI